MNMRSILLGLFVLASYVVPFTGHSATTFVHGNANSVPAFFWTCGCTPTALSMVLGHWDWQQGPFNTRHTGYGRLIESYSQRKWASRHYSTDGGAFQFDDHSQSPDDAIPDMLYTLAIYMKTTSADGGTYSYYNEHPIEDAAEKYANNFCGYNFNAEQTFTIWDWDTMFELVKTEINAFRPCVWSGVADWGGTSGGHSVCAVGYDEDSIYYYNTWDPIVRDRPYNEGFSTRMHVCSVIPGGGKESGLGLIEPSSIKSAIYAIGGACQVTWFQTGSLIDHVDILYSADGGLNYAYSHTRTSLPGTNSTVWHVPASLSTTNQCLIKVVAFDEFGRYLEADGSDRAFRLGKYPDLCFTSITTTTNFLCESQVIEVTMVVSNMGQMSLSESQAYYECPVTVLICTNPSFAYADSRFFESTMLPDIPAGEARSVTVTNYLPDYGSNSYSFVFLGAIDFLDEGHNIFSGGTLREDPVAGKDNNLFVSGGWIARDLVANFVATPFSGVAPLTVQFEDTSPSTLGLNFQWEYGDGFETNGHLHTPQYTYSSNGRYTVTMRYSLGAGPGGWPQISKTNYIVVGHVPPMPSSFAATLTGERHIDLSWDNSGDQDAFFLSRRIMGGAEDLHYQVLPRESTTWTDTNVEIGQTYLYRISATNNLGSSDWSPTRTVIVTDPDARVYVDAASVDPVPPYDNWYNAARGIPEAVEQASLDQTIIVAAGTYPLTNGTLILDGRKRMESADTPWSTILQGPDASVVVRGGATLDGFKITDCSADNGGGVTIDGTGLVTRCVITGNSAVQAGGGVYCSGAAAVLSNCYVFDNSASFGGGVYFEMGGQAVHSWIYENYAFSGGGAFLNQGGTLDLVEISDNGAVFNGGGVYFSGSGGAVSNCMIIANQSEGNGGGLGFAGGGMVEASIILSNTAAGAGGGAHMADGGTIAKSRILDCVASQGGGAYLANAGFLTHCDIMGNIATQHQGGGVYINTWGTVRNCILTGNQATYGGGIIGEVAGTVESCTIWNNVAFRGGGVYLKGSLHAVNTLVWSNQALESADYDNYVLEGALCGFQACCLYPPVTGANDLGGNIYTDPLVFDAGSTNLRLSADSPCRDSGANEDWMHDALDMEDFPRIANMAVDMGAYEVSPEHFIALNGLHRWPYASWATAATNAMAIYAAAPGDTVWVTNGIYQLASTFWVERPITVRSVNGREVTTLNAGYPGRTNRCVKLENGAIMEGFDIRGGCVDGDIWPENTGGGVWMQDNSILQDCTVIYNRATWGAGGVYAESGGYINACTIRNNKADFIGGGLFLQAGCTAEVSHIRYNQSAYAAGAVLYEGGTLRDVLVVCNHASEQGGGVECYLDGSIENSTLADNTAVDSAAGLLCVDGGQIENTIVWNNRLETGELSDTVNEGATNMRYRNSCITPMVAPPLDAGGNMTNDPQFVFSGEGGAAAISYELDFNSPCINSGTEQPWMWSSFDLAWNLRISGPAPDIGAYEVGWTSGIDFGAYVGYTNAPWVGGGSAWQPFWEEGSGQIVSGSIGDNQNTWIKTTVTGPCTLSFWWKTWSEFNYDLARFYVDDVLQSGEVSGETEWVQCWYAVGAGSHTLTWMYTKDAYISEGLDYASLSNVQVVAGSDTDIDALPDAWELRYFQNLTIAGSGTDADNDLFSDENEFIAGTDPSNPESLLRTVSAMRRNNLLEISWSSISGVNYLIDQSTNLMQINAWEPVTVPGIIFGTSDVTQTAITNIDPSAYYRIRIQR